MKKYDEICVSLDIETTGFDFVKDQIIEIGAVKFQGEKVLETFDKLINPQMKVPYNVLKVTGINEAELEKAVSIEQVLPKLKEFLGNHPIVGHNIDFDLNFLAQQGIKINNSRFDTWHLATILLPEISGYSLEVLTKNLGIEHLEQHRALADAFAAKDLFLFLIDKISEIPPRLLYEIKDYIKKSDWSSGQIFLKTESSRPVPKIIKKPEISLTSSEISKIKALISILGRKNQINHSSLKEEDLRTLKIVNLSLEKNQKTLIESQASLFAYLLPAIYSAQSGKKIVISKFKKEKELEENLEKLKRFLPFNFTKLSPPENYLCLHKFAQFKKRKEFTSNEIEFLIKILIWQEITQTGDKSEIGLIDKDYNFFSQVACDSDCLDENCFFVKTLKKAQMSNIVVADLSFLIKNFQKYLKDFKYLIIDDAHMLEEAGTFAFSWFISSGGFLNLTEQLKIISEDKKILKKIEELEKSADIFWGVLAMFIKNNSQDKDAYRIRLSLDSNNKFLKDWSKLEGITRKLTQDLDNLINLFRRNKEVYKSIIQKLETIKNNLKIIIFEPQKEGIYWGELFGRKPEIKLGGVPLNIKRLVSQFLNSKEGVILISQSLALAEEGLGEFDYFKKRLGIEKFKDIKVTSSKKDIFIHILEDFPQPETLAYRKETFKLISNISLKNKAKTLVIFNSKAAVSEAYQILASDLEKKGIEVFGLGQNLNLNKLDALNKEGPVLILATDIILKKLAQISGINWLILVRLPFEPPTHPVTVSRREKSNQYSTNKAVIRFKQIISQFSKNTEKGLIFIADSRIVQKTYGQRFIDSLSDFEISYIKKPRT